jgi:hypothetical protein
MCHPVNLALFRCLPFLPAAGLAFGLNYVFMLVGMYCFLKRWDLGVSGSLIGALSYTFLGMNLHHYSHQSMGGAHFPFLMLTVDIVMRSPSLRQASFGAVGLAAVTASTLLTDHTQMVWACGVAEAGYALILGFANPISFWRLPLLALAKGVGLLGAAVQILPSLELWRQSQRYEVGRDFLGACSIPPINWVVQSLSPYLYKTIVLGYPETVIWPPIVYHTSVATSLDDFRTVEYGGYYHGAIAVPLVVWLIMRWKRLGSMRFPARAAVILGAVGLLFSFGRFTPLFEILVRVPAFNMFRCPGRYRIIYDLCIVFLMAISFTDLVRASEGEDLERPRWRRLWPLGAAALVSCALTLAIKVLASRFPDALLYQAVATRFVFFWGALLISAACLLVALAARGVRGALLALVLLFAADLTTYVIKFVGHSPWTSPSEMARRIDLGVDLPERFFNRPLHDGYDHRLALDGQILFFSGPIMLGAKFLDGYSALHPKRRLDYTTPAALRVAGVEWVCRYPREKAPYLETLTELIPRARLICSSRKSSDPRRDIQEIDVSATALTETDLRLPPGSPGVATLVSDRPGWVTIETRAATRQLLVLSESYFDGWNVRVDGQPRPILRVNGDFQGCVIDAGKHRVEFRFRPQGFVVGLQLSMLGILIMVLWLAAPLFIKTSSRRRGVPGGSPTR